jgi:hypothetical protein
MNETDEPGRRSTRIVVLIRARRRQRVTLGIPQGDADMTLPVQVARNLVQLGIRIRCLLQLRHDHLDELTRQPDHALVLSLDARPRLRDLPRDVDREAQRQHERQQEIDAPAQG